MHYTCCFLVISLDMILAASSIWMALSSSRMFPSEDCRVSRIWSSISLSCFLLAADWRIRAFLSSSNSGLGENSRERLYLTGTLILNHISQEIKGQKKKKLCFALINVMLYLVQLRFFFYYFPCMIVLLSMVYTFYKNKITHYSNNAFLINVVQLV